MKPDGDGVRRSGRENYCGCAHLFARGRMRVKARARQPGRAGPLIGVARCFVGPAEPAGRRVCVAAVIVVRVTCVVRGTADASVRWHRGRRRGDCTLGGPAGSTRRRGTCDRTGGSLRAMARRAQAVLANPHGLRNSGGMGAVASARWHRVVRRRQWIRAGTVGSLCEPRLRSNDELAGMVRWQARSRGGVGHADRLVLAG